MKYYFDTEFIEDGRTIDLISIGIVCEDGRELYAINSDAQLHLASDWVRKNVLPHLPTYGSNSWMSRTKIRDAVSEFCHVCFGKPEFWAYYDWVTMCQLFGTMMDLPIHFPKYCMDIKQLAVMLGNPKLPEQNVFSEHDALADARWNVEAHRFLCSIIK